MSKNLDRMSIIHESLLNGQRSQMVEQIDRWFAGYNFWKEYKYYLEGCCYNTEQVLEHFCNAVISYHNIKG